MNEVSLPIEHLSYSSMKLFCANQQQFFKNYILGVWDYKSSMVATVGKAFHKAAEIYYKQGNWDLAIDAGLEFINKIKDDEVDWGKTGSREQLIKDFHAAISFYQAEEPQLGKVLGVELNTVTDHGFDGEQLPVPVKAISDLVTEEEKGIVITDHKVVATFTDKEEEQPDYTMQAMFNYLTVQAKFGKAPYSMIFREIKKTQNRDGSSQIDEYEVIYEKHPEYRLYFLSLYTDVIVTLSDENHRYLPNFGDMYSGKEAWVDYTAGKIDFKTLPKVSHRTKFTGEVRDVKFIEQAMEEDTTLTEEQKIKAKLKEFGMAVEMDETHKGLNVTLYTMKPSRGIRMSQFVSHAQDIAQALAAKSVRVEAPIAGTSLVGFEISNSTQGIAPWTEELIQKDTMNIPIGVDVYGESKHINLAKAPHLLVGGATGSGKSVFMNVAIDTLIKQNDAENMKLMLIDPKRTEFIDYENDDHLIYNIITESEDASIALNWATEEMESRYKQLRDMRVKTIEEYRKNKNDMPYLVIVIDELADLMLSPEQKEIEKSIVRLAQKARAVGIHLIVATQRPSVDVVTGLIKANFPTRVSFMVSTQVDSKVIIDEAGAEKLVGNGDLLLMNPREKGLKRLQGYYK